MHHPCGRVHSARAHAASSSVHARQLRTIQASPSRVPTACAAAAQDVLTRMGTGAAGEAMTMAEGACPGRRAPPPPDNALEHTVRAHAPAGSAPGTIGCLIGH